MRTIIDAPNGVPADTEWGRGVHEIVNGALVCTFPHEAEFGADHQAPLFTPAEGELFVVEQEVRFSGDYLGAARSKCKIGGWGFYSSRHGKGYGCRKGTRREQGVSLRGILRSRVGIGPETMLWTAYPYLMQRTPKRCGWPRVLHRQAVTVGDGSPWHHERIEIGWNTGKKRDGSLRRWVDGRRVENRRRLCWWWHHPGGDEPQLSLWLNAWRLSDRWPGTAQIAVRNLTVKAQEPE